MSMTMTRPTELRRAPTVRAEDAQSSFLARWLRVWVVLLVVVTLVVVGYLIVITNTLASINGNLGTADRAVQGTGRNVTGLPREVDAINGSLAAIDPALKPIPSQADQIIAALASINDKLGQTDASLKDTSSVLGNVLSQVNGVNELLIDINDPPDRLGVQDIHRRVAAANGANSPAVPGALGGGTCGEFCSPTNLTVTENDASNILDGLKAINGHLRSVCNSFIGTVLEGAHCRG